ncbi:MAG: SDR family oxidoreductase [Rhodospirillaceae bacterium]|nr:SDR family oxidoreductase [Rhodospirillales bacterium]
MLLKSRTAIVTGCNRGIGKAVLETLAHNGADIWACARQPSDDFLAFIEDLKRATGSAIEPVFFDLADSAAVKEGVKAITGAKKPIDILVNNAGAIHTSPFMMLTEAKMREMFEVNFFSQMIFTQYIARTMVRQRKGSIINISSSAAIEGNEGRAAYAAAKSALITASKVMSRELGPANVRVNAIAPGLTQTDMMTGSTSADALTSTVERTAMRRVGKPEEIAGAVLFLASDLSSYVTGQVLRVDGGM